MTKEEAMKLAEEYASLHEEADHEMENGCERAAACLREEAEAIEARLRDHGFVVYELLYGPGDKQ